MELHVREPSLRPTVSVILSDWSCRESFHSLRYLNEQTVARNRYELIWVEFYSRRPAEIGPQVDQWVILEMPDQVCYHKHLTYNAGIVRSRGDIVVICDSDAMFSPTFIESVIAAFKKDDGIFLHLDEVRNGDRRFYPFNYPSFDAVRGPGSINWSGDRTTGLLDESNPLHSRNYGACFCAKREDLISIGGADEHIDYLGHVCGPYELSFRLRNAGKRELWHESEFLYHTWHPGTDGEGNMMGPHDGWSMSTTALQCLRSGRVLPLVENAAIRLLRTPQAVEFAPVERSIIPARELVAWRVSSRRAPGRRRSSGAWLHVAALTARQVIDKARRRLGARSAPSLAPAESRSLPARTFSFINRMWKNSRYMWDACQELADRLARKETPIFVYGEGPAARMLVAALKSRNIAPAGRFGDVGRAPDLTGATVVVGAMIGTAERAAELARAGVPESDIVRIQ